MLVMEEITTKVCTKCKVKKGVSEFSKQAKGKLGVSSICKICHKYYKINNKDKYTKTQKLYKLTNKEKIAKDNKEYQKLNKSKISDKGKVYRESRSKEDIDKHKTQMKTWYLENYENRKHVYYFHNSLRRARLESATPKWANLESIKSIYQDCISITKQTGIPYHVDHIIPLNGKLVSGLHIETNLQIIPAKENLSKRNYLIEELI